MNKSSTPDFYQVQQTFTQHMRDPDNNPAPEGIEERRLAIYRRLLFNNISSFMANSFPVVRKILDDITWKKLIRDYFSHHQAHTPLFPKMPQEFVQYLQTERNEPEDLPFLTELAHYEWMGMSLKFDGREIKFDGIDRDGNLMAGVPCLNPLTAIMSYQFPVHNIDPEHIPDTAPDQPTFLVVYRDEHDEIGYLELNPVSARLLDLVLQNESRSGLELLQQIAEELQHPNPDVVIQGGLQIMQQMNAAGILLGTLNS